MSAFTLLAYVAAAASPAAPQPVPAILGTRTIRASAADLFGIAENLERRGRSRDAERLFELLSRNPDPNVRNEARYRRAKLLLASGQERDAALLLRRIIDEKPNAAPVRLELAQLLDKMGDKDGAWRQVRAAQAAGLPPQVARLVDRYSEALRAVRSSGASFEIALAPDSNINHATRSDTLGTIFGDFDIDKDSKAKSGTGLALQGQAFRRLPLGDERQMLFRLSGFADLYSKSRFNDVAVDFSAGPELQIGSSRINLVVGATQRFYGQKPFLRSGRLGASAAIPFGRLSQVRLVGTAALIDNQVNDLENGKTYSGQVSFEHALSPTTGVALTGSATREALRDPGYSTRSWRVGLLGWRDIGRVTLTAEAQIGRLGADERLSLFPDKRKDEFSRLTIGATFRRLGFAGFAPVARFVIERNRSTIAFYDYRRMRSEMGIVRAF